MAIRRASEETSSPSSGNIATGWNDKLMSALTRSAGEQSWLGQNSIETAMQYLGDSLSGMMLFSDILLYLVQSCAEVKG